MPGNALSDWAALAGRLMLAIFFAAAVAQKLLDPQPTFDLLAGRGLPALLFWPAFALTLVGAICLALGVLTRTAALALALYCMATSVFHLIPADPWQMSIFAKNWALAGGLLVLAAHGPGRHALRPAPARDRMAAADQKAGPEKAVKPRLTKK